MELLKTSEEINRNIKKKLNLLKEELSFDFYKHYLNQNKNLIGFPNFIKLGNLINNLITIPCLLSTEKIHGIAFKLNESNREEINLTMEHIALQILEQMKQQYCEITIIDPLQLGSNFRNVRRLHKKVLFEKVFEEQAIEKCVQLNYNKTVSVINECLLHFNSIEDYNKNSGHKQPYRIILISDFPHSFRNCIKELNTILMNAKDAGVFVLMSVNTKLDSEYFETELDNTMEQMVKLTEYNEDEDLYKVSNIDNENFYNDKFTIKLDRRDINIDRLSSIIIKQNKSFTKKENTDSSAGGLRIPIGKVSGITFYFTLGHDSDNFHGIIGGQSGKGKTVLLNNIISKGIESYDAEDLVFAIVDCSGVGFQKFKESNRIAFFESSISQKVCSNLIVQLDNELKKRERLFKNVKVDDIDKYNIKSDENLPRLMIIIDEFHVLFSDEDWDSKALVDAILVDRIIRIGRKFGIHLVLSTQSLDGIPQNILNNIPLRIALGMTRDESYNFLEMRNDAAANLDRGIAIYNTKNGSVNHNKKVLVNYIKEDEINRILNL